MRGRVAIIISSLCPEAGSECEVPCVLVSALCKMQGRRRLECWFGQKRGRPPHHHHDGPPLRYEETLAQCHCRGAWAGRKALSGLDRRRGLAGTRHRHSRGPHSWAPVGGSPQP